MQIKLKYNHLANENLINILAFYFLFDDFKSELYLDEEKLFFLKLLSDLKIKGTVLVSSEGINGTIAGSKESIESFFLEFNNRIENFYNLSGKKSIFEYKYSYNDFVPFQKLKILQKNEVVALKSNEDLDYSLKPINLNSEEWDKILYSNLKEDLIQIIDTRNDYEFNIGTFLGAINPNIKNFREFKDYIQNSLDSGELNPENPCAIFCTGGIRCEKAGIFMRNKGFKKVYQLKGGILKYFEDTKNKNKNWIGDCFVFDDRIVVNDNLEQGQIRCINCKKLIQTNEERKSITKAKIYCKDCKK